MSDKFDSASRAWGRVQLHNAGISFNEVTSVYFQVVHGQCYCGEYCYCYKDDSVEATIDFKVAGIAQTHFHSVFIDLGDLLRQVTEW